MDFAVNPGKGCFDDPVLWCGGEALLSGDVIGTGCEDSPFTHDFPYALVNGDSVEDDYDLADLRDQCEECGFSLTVHGPHLIVERMGE